MGSRLECSQGDENNLTVWERKREIGNTVLLVTNIFCLAINLSCILPPAWLHYRNMNTSGTPEQNESELALYQGLWEACFISSNKNSKKICQSLDYRLAKVRTPQLIFSVTTVLTLVSVLMACLEPFRVFFYMEKHSHIFIRGTSLIVGVIGVIGSVMVGFHESDVEAYTMGRRQTSLGTCFYLSLLSHSTLSIFTCAEIFVDVICPCLCQYLCVQSEKALTEKAICIEFEKPKSDIYLDRRHTIESCLSDENSVGTSSSYGSDISSHYLRSEFGSGDSSTYGSGQLQYSTINETGNGSETALSVRELDQISLCSVTEAKSNTSLSEIDFEQASLPSLAVSEWTNKKQGPRMTPQKTATNGTATERLLDSNQQAP